MTSKKPKSLKVLFASNNPGKITDAQVFVKGTNIELLTPKDLGLKLDPDETGNTYEENALIKAKAFQEAAGDPDLIVVSDDGGIEIPTLNNEPGVYSRRWKGYVMSDQEIVDYCLERMQGKKGVERDANFVGVICVLMPGRDPQYFRGVMKCHITEEPATGEIIEGFPFRSLMYVPELKKMIYDVHGTTIAERGGFMNHREQGLQAAFAWVAKQTRS